MPYPKPYQPQPGQHIDFWVLDPDSNDRLYFAYQALGAFEGALDDSDRDSVGCSAEELSGFLSLIQRELDAVMADNQPLPRFLEDNLVQDKNKDKSKS